MKATHSGNDNFDGDVDDSFGYSVSLSASGRHLAVGAPGYKNGHVQLYVQSKKEGAWSRYGAPIDETSAFMLFGVSVQLSADGARLAVRSLHSGILMGGVYVVVYLYEDGRWYPDPSYTLRVSGGSTFDTSQSAMAFSGEGKTVALVSTVLDSTNGNGASNKEDTTQITLLHNYKFYTIYLKSTIHHSDHYLSLSYNGNRIAYSDRERVVVKEFYNKNLFFQTWEQVGLGIQSDNANEEDFGSAVVLSPDGNFLAITSKTATKVYVAPPHDVNGKATAWTQVGNTIDSDNVDQHLTDVSLWSHKLTMGDGSGTVDLLTLAISDSGSVRILQYNTRVSTDWTLKGGDSAGLHNTGGEQWPTGFGRSLSVSEDGETVAVGAPVFKQDGEDFKDGGKVLIYDLKAIPS